MADILADEPVSAHWLTTRSDEEAAAHARAAFVTAFQHEPEGVWAAPGRVNLIGEHVDYAGGLCLPFALTQCAFVALARNDDHVYRVVDANMPEPPVIVAVDAVGPKSPKGWTGYIAGAIWAAAQAGLLGAAGSEQGFDVALSSDVPLGAGLSSSAALECSAAVGAVEIMHGRQITEAERSDLVAPTMRAENEIVGANTGGLDQKASLFGQEGYALAVDFGTGDYRQVPFTIADQHLAILVANTNAPHSLADGQYASRRGVIDGVAAHAGEKFLRFVTDPDTHARAWAAESVPEGESEADWQATVKRRVRHVVSEIARTENAIKELEANDFAAFGESMQRSHLSLKYDYEVTTPELDLVVEVAMATGALGARMTGGGFGGSAIALLPASRLHEAADAIALAFAQQNFPVPEFIAAVPSAGARRVN